MAKLTVLQAIFLISVALWSSFAFTVAGNNNITISSASVLTKLNSLDILRNVTLENLLAAASVLVSNRTGRMYYGDYGDRVYGDRHDTYAGNEGWGSKQYQSKSYRDRDDYSSESYSKRGGFYDESDNSGYSSGYNSYGNRDYGNPYGMNRYQGGQGWGGYGGYGSVYGGGYGNGRGAYGNGYYQRPSYGGYYGSQPYYPPTFYGSGFGNDNLILLLLLLRRLDDIDDERERNGFRGNSDNNNDNNGPLQRLLPLIMLALPLLQNILPT